MGFHKGILLDVPTKKLCPYKKLLVCVLYHYDSKES